MWLAHLFWSWCFRAGAKNNINFLCKPCPPFPTILLQFQVGKEYLHFDNKINRSSGSSSSFSWLPLIVGSRKQHTLNTNNNNHNNAGFLRSTILYHPIRMRFTAPEDLKRAEMKPDTLIATWQRMCSWGIRSLHMYMGYMYLSILIKQNAAKCSWSWFGFRLLKEDMILQLLNSGCRGCHWSGILIIDQRSIKGRLKTEKLGDFCAKMRH